MEIWRGQQEGLNVVIVNPGVIFGSGFWNQGSGLFFTKIKKGFPFYTNGLTAYVGVTDVVKIMIQLMKNNIVGERFTVIAENVTFKNVIFSIASILGLEAFKFSAIEKITFLKVTFSAITVNRSPTMLFFIN